MLHSIEKGNISAFVIQRHTPILFAEAKLTATQNYSFLLLLQAASLSSHDQTLSALPSSADLLAQRSLATSTTKDKQMDRLRESGPWLAGYIEQTMRDPSITVPLTGHYLHVVTPVKQRRMRVSDGKHSMDAMLTTAAATQVDADDDDIGVTVATLCGCILTPVQATVIPEKSYCTPTAVLLLRKIAVFPDRKLVPPTASPCVLSDSNVAQAILLNIGRSLAQLPSVAHTFEPLPKDFPPNDVMERARALTQCRARSHPPQSENIEDTTSKKELPNFNVDAEYNGMEYLSEADDDHSVSVPQHLIQTQMLPSQPDSEPDASGPANHVKDPPQSHMPSAHKHTEQSARGDTPAKSKLTTGIRDGGDSMVAPIPKPIIDTQVSSSNHDSSSHSKYHKKVMEIERPTICAESTTSGSPGNTLIKELSDVADLENDASIPFTELPQTQRFLSDDEEEDDVLGDDEKLDKTDTANKNEGYVALGGIVKDAVNIIVRNVMEASQDAYSHDTNNEQRGADAKENDSANGLMLSGQKRDVSREETEAGNDEAMSRGGNGLNTGVDNEKAPFQHGQTCALKTTSDVVIDHGTKTTIVKEKSSILRSCDPSPSFSPQDSNPRMTMPQTQLFEMEDDESEEVLENTTEEKMEHEVNDQVDERGSEAKKRIFGNDEECACKNSPDGPSTVDKGKCSEKKRKRRRRNNPSDDLTSAVIGHEADDLRAVGQQRGLEWATLPSAMKRGGAEGGKTNQNRAVCSTKVNLLKQGENEMNQLDEASVEEVETRLNETEVGVTTSEISICQQRSKRNQKSSVTVRREISLSEGSSTWKNVDTEAPKVAKFHSNQKEKKSWETRLINLSLYMQDPSRYALQKLNPSSPADNFPNIQDEHPYTPNKVRFYTQPESAQFIHDVGDMADETTNVGGTADPKVVQSDPLESESRQVNMQLENQDQVQVLTQGAETAQPVSLEPTPLSTGSRRSRRARSSRGSRGRVVTHMTRSHGRTRETDVDPISVTADVSKDVDVAGFSGNAGVPGTGNFAAPAAEPTGNVVAITVGKVVEKAVEKVVENPQIDRVVSVDVDVDISATPHVDTIMKDAGQSASDSKQVADSVKNFNKKGNFVITNKSSDLDKSEETNANVDIDIDAEMVNVQEDANNVTSAVEETTNNEGIKATFIEGEIDDAAKIVIDSGDPEVRNALAKVKADLDMIRRVRRARDRNPTAFVLFPELFKPSQLGGEALICEQKSVIVSNVDLDARSDALVGIADSAPI